jgi:hypothetical protein
VTGDAVIASTGGTNLLEAEDTFAFKTKPI